MKKTGKILSTFSCVVMVVVFFAVAVPMNVSAAPETINVPEDYLTIQGAIYAANSGDTVQVAPGTYFENIRMKDGVDLLGAGAEVTTIDGQGHDIVVNARVNDATISGFTLKNGNRGVYIYGSWSPSVRNNVIVDNKFGIGVWHGANPDIRNNIIKNNLDGIYVYGSDEDESPTNPSIINNTIVSNERGGITLRVKVSPTILNNIITGHVNGWWLEGEYHENSWGLHYNYVTGSPALSYNDLWNNDANYMHDNVADDTLAGTSSISADPLFVDPATGDYHLEASSPCINAGDPNPTYNDPDGTRNDMGAYYGTPVVTPEDAVDEIGDNLPALPGGSETALTNQLDQALARLEDARNLLADGRLNRAQNRYCQAIGKVEDFITNVEDKVPGEIDPDTGSELVDAAEALITLIEEEMVDAGLVPCDG